MLEVGNGWTFVARQKRMTVDNDDFYLDLLFFSRSLRRLIAVELKIGKFKPGYMGQMNLYLKWLNRYDRQPGEETPIGLILCAEASREQIELLEMDKNGIAVAEYWTTPAEGRASSPHPGGLPGGVGASRSPRTGEALINGVPSEDVPGGMRYVVEDLGSILGIRDKIWMA